MTTEAVKETKKSKSKSYLNGMIGIGIGLVLAISLGVGTGYILSGVFPPYQKPDLTSDLDPLNYAVSAKEKAKLLESYKGDPLHTKLKKWDLINAAFSKFENSKYNQSKGIGKAAAIIGPLRVDQQIRSTMIRNDESFFEESLSRSSAVKVAWRMYQDNNKDGKTYRYKGDCPNDVEKPVFNANAEPTMVATEEEYLEAAGRNLDGNASIYIVSEKTMASSEQDVTSGLPFEEIKTNDDGSYTINLELNPLLSTLYYVRQMKQTTPMNSTPIFDYVHLSVTFTKDLDLISSTSTERYFASTPSGSSNIEGALTTTFSVGNADSFVIPSLTDVLPYTH